jgi:hypothetical protein
MLKIKIKLARHVYLIPTNPQYFKDFCLEAYKTNFNSFLTRGIKLKHEMTLIY